MSVLGLFEANFFAKLVFRQKIWKLFSHVAAVSSGNKTSKQDSFLKPETKFNKNSVLLLSLKENLKVCILLQSMTCSKLSASYKLFSSSLYIEYNT